MSQRGKEEAHDYRYMPEPDIPPVELTDDYIDEIGASMPILPDEWREKLAKLGLDKSYTDTLLLAEAEDERFSYLGIIESNVGDKELANTLANWFINIEIPMRRSGEADDAIKDEARAEIWINTYELVKAGKLSSTSSKALLTELLKNGLAPEDLEKYAEEKGYIQVSDEGEIEKIVDEVIKENAKAAEDVKNGEMRAIGFLVGQVMQKSQGKANPALAQKVIKKHLGV